MNRKNLIITAAVLVVAIAGVFTWMKVSAGMNQPSQPNPAFDPQKLLVPRWFLRSLTLDGKNVEISPDQQKITIQFQPDGKMNGTGGCNSFGSSYKAGKDGTMTFEPIVSTMMACEGTMDTETVYYNALSKVTKFHFDGMKLTLSSPDSQTSLGFSLPPK
jgi:heat shock protein HslJ